MARQMFAVNGGGGDLAPPPSTLAAQIVQNQSRPAATQQNGLTPTFPQLLNEILNNPAATQEESLTVNVKLIDVVCEAGLAPLGRCDPFSQPDELLAQAKDSIAVVERTIKQQPEVLLMPSHEGGPQVALLLFSQVAALCGKPVCDKLLLAALIDTTINAIAGSPELWQSAALLQEVCCDLVEDTVSALETHSDSSAGFSVTLPPAKSVTKLWPQSENAIALPVGCQVSISNVAQAFVLALSLSCLSFLHLPWRQEVLARLNRLSLRYRSQLEKAKQWEKVQHQLLSLQDNLPTLLSALQQCAKVRVAPEIQLSLARALIQSLRDLDPIATEDLLPELKSVAISKTFDALHEDLRIAITTWLSRFLPQSQLPESALLLRDALRQDNAMTDSELQTAFHQLSIADNCTNVHSRRRKRRKINSEDSSSDKTALITRLASLLGNDAASDLAQLPQTAPTAYKTLDDSVRCEVWLLLKQLAELEPLIATETVSYLLQLPELSKSPRPRVVAMSTLRVCVDRSQNPDVLDLAQSVMGKICLSSLHSSIRELRIAASQCLPSFVRDGLPNDLTTRNRHTALEYLRVLSDRDIASEHETLIAAWGQLALASGDREIELILLRLVDYLGHPNSLICGVAFEEIDKLAARKQWTVEELLRPYWITVAPSVVHDLQSRPQKAQQLCDLLGINMNEFLVRTQQFTIPGLVQHKRTATLQRIAAARGTTVQDICLQPKGNLAATVALLLSQPASEPEEAAQECLAAVAPEFKGVDMSNLIRLDAALIACEMLKQSGDASESRKSRAYHAIQVFAAIAERRPGQSRPHSKSSRNVTEFFDSHVLGIMTHFSQVVEDTGSLHTTNEKHRCLKGVRDMVTLSKTSASIALPQLRAFLASAMQYPELCETAFSCWLALLSVLGPDDIGHMLEQTFALIVQYWACISYETQQTIHSKIAELLRTHNKLVQDHLMTLPSLSSIPLLAKFASEMDRLRSQETVEGYCRAFELRLQEESMTVVKQAVKELLPFLEEHSEFIHDAAVSEQPVPAVSGLLRALLDVTTRHASGDRDIAEKCGKALGIIGCLDPNRVEVMKKKRQVLILSNFESANEVVSWVIVMIEDVLVKAFRSVTNARAQGFLAYVMQELLRFCGFNEVASLRTRSSQAPSMQQRWMALPEHVRITLTPLLTSRYSLLVGNPPPNRVYPGFSMDVAHSTWLRSLVYDLMWKGKGDNAKMVFPLLARITRGHDLAIPTYLLPYAILNVVLGGTVAEVQGIKDELCAVLQSRSTTSAQLETVKLCSETVFGVLDYMSSWLQEKKKSLSHTRAEAYRTGQSPSDFDEAKDMGQIDEIERFLASIPAESLATRAIECGSYARALFNWEQYIRQERALIPSGRMSPHEVDIYERLHTIYASIDEPDGLEGIGSHLPFLSEEQQVVQHTKAGRWTAAQAWYEMRLANEPSDVQAQTGLLDCLRQTGQYAPLLRHAQSFLATDSLKAENYDSSRSVLSLAVEAQWMTGDIDGLRAQLEAVKSTPGEGFDLGIGRAFTVASESGPQPLFEQIVALRRSIVEGMTEAGTSSLQACHDDLRKLHALYELEALNNRKEQAVAAFMDSAEKRLAALGSSSVDKQYILGVRRAAMRVRSDVFSTAELGSRWLATARLARKAGNTHSAYHAVLQASACGDNAAKLEEARLLWHDGERRQAIQALESAIESGVFDNAEGSMEENSESSERHQKQNMLSARAHLLLAKWMDASGQTQAKDMITRYQFAAKHFQRWEKGHYYLGKHYNKLLEAEKSLPKNKQSELYHSGEMARQVIENLMRSIPFGNKYWHQTIPRILTLWLDLGKDTIRAAPKEDQHVFERRVRALQLVHKQLQKYVERIPAYVFYTALPQLVSRISHPNPDVWKQLSSMLARIVAQYPSQALWSILAVVRASDKVRAERAQEILNRLKDPKSRLKTDGTDVRALIVQGQRLSDGLLQACEVHVEQRKAHASLSRDLHFNHKLAPAALVVPIEAALTVNLPAGADSDKIRRHAPFARDKITILSFQDDVLVLSSLQRPRKITARASDGRLYGLLCKPKDDLRKDQRLMEFNGIINRALKRDSESSKRRLYIKTYAVTPLSEESGILEWVEGIKPIRDILLGIYARRGVKPNYTDIKNILQEACASPDKAHLFDDQVLSLFPPTLHEWFTETYAEPDSWFAARLRYARSAAVMSITGHILGLGDRHGENILLEEGTGGVFHVDFNCLFDKGLTFEKPELVPFRLTHNMVDAMGAYGYEGPFRKSCELTLRLLRQNKDTLMTVLETFLYDPTTDFVGKKKRSTAGVPETPQEILDSVDAKLKGLLKGENVPLGVEGYCDVLIREATSSFNLASMYIGWCAFL